MKPIEIAALAAVTGGESPWYHPDGERRDYEVYDYKPRGWTECAGGFWHGCPDERIRK